MTKTNFGDLGLSQSTLDAINSKGFTHPTPIQEQVIPLLLSGDKDIIGQANTGTGKTAAFGLPIIEKIKTNQKTTQAIILVPTRELAIQVAEEMKSFIGTKNISIALVYGGQMISKERRSLKQGAHIVVGTPGRIKDHLNRKSLNLDQINFFVLDEADEMLNVGFRDDIEQILSTTPTNKQILLFSATMPKSILDIINKYMKDYDTISIKGSNTTNINISQKYFEVLPKHKFDALCRIIETEPEFYGIVFCRTKLDVDEVSSLLNSKGLLAEGIHGDIDQKQREKTLSRFKKQKTKILIATDVAARGIDVNNLTHVINYTLPENPEQYTHRIGRTGRAGKTGIAISLVTKRDKRKLYFIEKVIKTRIQKATLPTAKDIIIQKRNTLIDNIHNIIENGNIKKDYLDLAQELISQHNDPQTLISAILQHAYPKTFDTQSYTDITNVTSHDISNNMRLFIAKGRNQGLSHPKDIVKMIQKDIDIRSQDIDQIKIFDNFSYATLPFLEADILISLYKKRSKGKPIIAKAKPRK